MSKFAKDLIESLTEAAAHARGEQPEGVRLTSVRIPNVKSHRDLAQDVDRMSVIHNKKPTG